MSKLLLLTAFLAVAFSLVRKTTTPRREPPSRPSASSTPSRASENFCAAVGHGVGAGSRVVRSISADCSEADYRTKAFEFCSTWPTTSFSLEKLFCEVYDGRPVNGTCVVRYASALMKCGPNGVAVLVSPKGDERPDKIAGYYCSAMAEEKAPYGARFPAEKKGCGPALVRRLTVQYCANYADKPFRIRRLRCRFHDGGEQEDGCDELEKSEVRRCPPQ